MLTYGSIIRISVMPLEGVKENLKGFNKDQVREAS